MGVHRKPGIRPVAQRLIVTALLLIGTHAFAEVEFEYEIRNNPVGVKDRIFVNIYVDHPEPNDVKAESPPLPKEIRITSGPKITRVAADGEFKTRISYQLRGEETGRYILKPFIVKLGEETLETDTRILEVGRYRSRLLYMPLEAEWHVPAGPYHVGQSFPVSLQLINQLEIPLVDDLEVTYPKGAFFEEIQGIAEIESIPAGDRYLYDIPVVTYMFTPSQAGRLFLPAAELSALDETTESPTVRIDVQQLPADARETGGVGVFLLRTTLDTSRYSAGSVGKLSITVEGEGNLVYLNPPSPEWGELVQTDAEESSSITPGLNGYSGFRKVVYSFISDGPGDFTVTVPDFVFFQPDSEEVRTARGSTFRVTFDPPARPVPEAESTFPFSAPQLDDILEARTWGAYRNPQIYLWLLPAPLAFIVLFILKRTKILFVALVALLLAAGDVGEEPCPALSPAAEAYRAGDYRLALDGFLTCAKTAPENPRLLYALALTEYQLGSLDDAMYFARSAVRRDPMDRELRDFLIWLNGTMSLEKPVFPAAGIHPDVFLFFMIGFFTAGFVALTAYLLRRNGLYIVIFLLGMLLSLGSCGGLAYTATLHARETAIVYGQTTEVKKIPSATASEWLTLPAGYSLRVLDETDEFYLVRTAYGLSGWIAKNNLVLDRR